MTFFDSLLLGLLQGLTEFLPISSSGHLVLAEAALHIQWDPNDLKAFDVILHAGTLLALLVYFWRDWLNMLTEARESLVTRTYTQSLLFKIILATIPAVIIGLGFNEQIDSLFRNTSSVALMMFLVGIILFICEIIPKKKPADKPSFWQAIIIGCAQAVALIPGISRSGSTIAAAMFQGVKRREAAKFSFLLGTPAIAGATTLIAYKIWQGEYLLPAFSITLIGFLASAVSSLLCMHFLLQFVRNYSLRIFSLYLCLVALIIFINS